MNQDKYSILNKIAGMTLTGIVPPITLSDNDLKSLLFSASIMSLDDAPEERNKAQQICLKLIEYYGASRPWLITAARTLLARLGNLPAEEYILKEYSSDATIETPRVLELESKAKRIENSVVVPGYKDKVFLTDLQKEFLNSFESSNAVSISAPTSSGKSFALKTLLLRYIQSKNNVVAVYLLPTRALLAQVFDDLNQIIKKSDLQGTKISTIPVSTSELKSNKIVYILTQERYRQLLYADKNLKPDLLLVDEASGIEEGDRGILLIDVVNETITRNSSTRVLFASVMINNPELFFKIFDLDKNTYYVRDQYSPVAQNIVRLRSVKNKVNDIRVEMAIDNEFVNLGTTTAPFRFRGSSAIVEAAKHFSRPDDVSILYCNGPSEAEKRALALADIISEVEDDEELNDLIQDIQEYVHPEYLLADTLKRGIAFHYRSVPDVVRDKLEELASRKVIKYICCTSTLLQGVNLPAKNIFITRPQSGRGKKMTPRSFWNLAGRAGRLGKDIEGNIFCVEAEAWDEPLFAEEKSSTLKDAFSTTLNLHKSLIESEIINTGNVLRTEPHVQQISSRIITDYIIPEKSLVNASFVNQENIDSIRNIESHAQEIRAAIYLPRDLLKRNSSFSPWRLQALHNYMKTNPSIIETLTTHPSRITMDSYKSIFPVIYQFLYPDLESFDWKIPNLSFFGLKSGL